MAHAQLSIAFPEELARQLPADPGERQQILALGLREWRIQKALAAYARGEGSLAFAANQAGVSLREIIPAAYARGLAPHLDPADQALTLDRAASL